MSDVFGRIDALMKSQKKQQKEMNEYLKLGQRTYDNWKSGKSSSYLKHLDAIATFLHVTPNYLISGSNDENLNNLEYEVLQLFRSIDASKQQWFINVLRTMISGLESTNYSDMSSNVDRM